MSNQDTLHDIPVIPPQRPHRNWKKYGFVAGTLATGALLGGIIGASASSTTTVTKTVAVPGPVSTKVVKVPVPGPTKTIVKTKTVPAPPPAAGQKIATFSGTGNQVTPSFNVPASGNYVVRWSYSGNIDNSAGTSMASNFIVSNTGDGDGSGLPNDIQSSGSGSTEVIGSSGATDTLNVQAIGSWTLTIVSA